MVFTDTHIHLYLSQFNSDRHEVVSRARDEGVRHMLMPNIDSHTAGPMLRVAGDYPGLCLPMMGLHPTSVGESYEAELDIIGSWFEKERFVAVGETGIDLYWDKTYLEEQKKSMERHIQWALEYDLPLVLHSRNSLGEIFELLEGYRDKGLRGVFHCFPGNAEEAAKAIEFGFMLGIGGVVTYSNSNMQDVVKSTGLEHMVLETDAPFLSPHPKRGKRNESAYLKYIAEKVGEFKGIDAGEVARATTANASRLFLID